MPAPQSAEPDAQPQHPQQQSDTTTAAVDPLPTTPPLASPSEPNSTAYGPQDQPGSDAADEHTDRETPRRHPTILEEEEELDFDEDSDDQEQQATQDGTTAMDVDETASAQDDQTL